MGKAVKVLCKWSKARLRKDAALLHELVSDPTHVCLDCGRAAGDKKVLCEPQRLDRLLPESR